MSLQSALILIGAIIIMAVVISTYDKARLGMRERRRRARQHTADKQESGVAGGGSAEANGVAYLDINPGPPVDLERKSLKSDTSSCDALRTQDSAFYRELESFERVAARPLNLGAGTGALRTAAASGLHSAFPAGRDHGPNRKIDFIVDLPGAGPVMRDEALGIYKQNEYVLERPRQLYGLRYLAGHWSPLERDSDDAQYSDLAVAIQLADSNGPIDESELSAFVQVALKLADALNRPTKLSMTVEHALECARELQRFAEKYDVIASVNVVANNSEGFSGPSIEQVARHHGMRFGAMNIFHMKNKRSAGCRHLFSMANLYEPGEFNPKKLDSFHTKGLTLFMSIPCVYEPVRVFEGMIKTGQGLCQILGGRLLDQDQRPLTDEGLSVIRQQIKRIAEDINAQGIVPGSEAALRFFSP